MNVLTTIAVVFAGTWFFLCSSVAMGHGGNANSKAWDICTDAKVGDVCEFVDHHEDLNRGTCRSFDEKLMCVRNKPIEPADVHTHKDAHNPKSKKIVYVLGGALFLGLLILIFRKKSKEQS